VQQQRIKELLEEAANATEARRIEIGRELYNATAVYTGSATTDYIRCSREAVCELVQHLYDSTLEHHPKRLPSFLPFFAMACEDRNRNEHIFAEEVNWDLMEDFSRLSD
jgi:hypothetical protein